MSKLRVLVACEFSGTVRDAFKERGHDAWSCDLIPTESIYKDNHYIGNVLTLFNKGWWDLMIAHPPCTYLTNAGVRHLHDHVSSRNNVKAVVNGSKRWEALFEGARFFNALKSAPIDKIAIENPIPHKYSRDLIGKYDQLIQPWMFGHGETKAICLWLKNLPKLQPTNIVTGREHKIHEMSPSSDRGKLRSIFYIGIAKAMSEQWG